MKSFLEEYGFAILAAIVVILLIAMCTPVGNMIKTQVLNMVDRFAGTADKKLAAADNDEMSANIIGGTLYVSSPSTSDKYLVVIHGTTAGSPVIYDLTGAAAENVDAGSELKNKTNAEGKEVPEAVKSKDLATAIADLDNGTTYYAEVKNVGTGYTFTSNIVTITK